MNRNEAIYEMSELVKVVFDLQDEDVASAEGIWAQPVQKGNFKLKNIPALAYGVNLGDVIRAERRDDDCYHFVRVVRRSGHRTFRVAPKDKTERLDLLRQVVHASGGQIERSGESYFAIDLPPNITDSSLISLLEQGETAGDWEFEESGINP